MFSWIKRKANASFWTSDTEKIVKNVMTLSTATQTEMARTIASKLIQAIAEIERTPGPVSKERDAVIRTQLESAKQMRHATLALGATSWGDPSWAIAALIESWLVANSGELGISAFERIDGLVFGWLKTVLSAEEISEIYSREF